MTQYFGDHLEDQTVYIPFNTFDSNDPSASVTITNLADADIMVHKDGSTTQITTDGATVAIDFDTITGNHLITIDTSVSADYSTGSDYLVRIEGTTVDGATINAWVGSFSIDNRAGARALRATTAGRTLDVTATGAAGIDWGNIENASTVVDLSATDINLCDTITTYTGNTPQTGDSFARLGAPAGASVSADVADLPTVSEFNARTLASAAYFDPAVDTVLLNSAATSAQLVDDIWDETLTGAAHNISTSAGRRLRTLASAVIRADTAQGAGTGNNQIQLDTGASSIDGSYDPSLISIVGGTGIGQSRNILEYNGTTRTATVDRNWKVNPDATSEFTIVANAGREHINEGLAQAGASTTITLNALASASDDVYNGQRVFIRSGTGEDQAKLILDYNGATKVATVESAWAVTPDTTSAYVILPNSPVALSPLTQASIDAIEADTNELQTDDIPTLIAALPTASENSDAVWDEILSGHVISGSSGEALSAAGTAGDPWTTALPGAYGAGTAGKIIGDNINATISSRATQASVDTIDGIVDTILIDTADLQANQGNWLTATGFATSGALATAQADLDTITGVGGVNLLPATQASIDAIEADTNEIQGDWVDGGRLDLILDARASQSSVDTIDSNVDSVLVDTSTTIPAQITSLNNLSAADILAAGDVDGYTIEETLKLVLASAAGTLSGAATTTVIIQAADGSKARLTATVDSDGNRTLVTKDVTG